MHGKIFAAFATPERRAAVLAQKRRKHTPHTVTDPEELRLELERVAEEDVAFDVQGMYANVCSVGSPVRDQLGRRRGRDVRGHAGEPLRPARA